MTTTNERKQNAVRIIDEIDDIIFNIDKLMKIRFVIKCKDEYKNSYNEFLKKSGVVDTLSKLYFGNDIKKMTQSFIRNCEGIYLKTELQFKIEEIKQMKKAIEEENKKVHSLEIDLEKINETNDSIKDIKLILERDNELARTKQRIEDMMIENESLNIVIIETNYEIKKLFGEESTKDMLIKVKNEKEVISERIKVDYKLRHRLKSKKFF